jgi:Cysteine-rich secretory protein family
MGKKHKPKTFPQHLKHWFVPHHHNDHRPHLIRAHGLALMALLIIGVQVTANVLRPPDLRVLAYATDITPLDLFNQTNQQRADNGLPPLRLDARLNESAGLKANNMFAQDYWAHVSPTGIQPWYWFTQAGYPYAYAGENLAKDFDSTSGTIQGWMNSPGHRANILNPNYTDVGFAVENGTLVGGQTTLVVAHYGSVAAAAAASSTPSAVPAPASVVKPVAVAAVPASPATPLPSPVASTVISPSPSAQPTSTSTPRPVVATGEVSPGAPAPQSYSLFRPLSIIRTLNLGTLVTIGLLGLLLLVYVITHLTVWRKGLGRWRSGHYKLFAAAQVSSLTVAIIVLAISGFGTVS